MSKSATSPEDRSGLRYGPHVFGKNEFRIRERHVADHLIPLISQKAVGAVKLDLVLRGVALLPEHAGARKVGIVLPHYSWEDLYDLAGTPRKTTSREDRRLKRKWIGEQLARLEALHLVERKDRPGQRPYLYVLSDRGDGSPYDAPDGSERDWYVRILGGVIASGTLAGWKAPELSAFLAAMIAERHDDEARQIRERSQPGAGRWFRPLSWFANVDGRYDPEESRVQFPFSVATLERGLARLEEQGLIERTKTTWNPVASRTFQGPRNVYRNKFFTLDAGAAPLTPAQLKAELALLLRAVPAT